MNSLCVSKFIRGCSIFVIMLIVNTVYINAQTTPVQIISKSNTDNSHSFNYKKNREGTYYVSVKFKNLGNALLSDFSGVINEPIGTLFTIHPIVGTKPVQFDTYSINYVKGNPLKKPDESFAYLLPYPKGEVRSLFFLSNIKEKYIQQKPSSDFKSFAFESNEFDTVCAIRRGVVIEINDKYEIDTSLYKSYTSKVNSIQIEHADGSIASYQGFKKEGIFVREGDVVLPHDRLGILSKYDAKKQYTLRLHVFYAVMKPDETGGQNSDSLTRNQLFEYRYLDPFFFTSEGVSKLQNKNKYKSNISESEYTKELGKKEQRKFEKNKQNLAVYLAPVQSLHQDTVFFEDNNQEVFSRDSAVTYKIVKAKTINTKTEIEYYISGKIKSETHWVKDDASLDKEDRAKASFYYYDKETKVRWFQHGRNKIWYENGNIHRDINYHVGRIQGQLLTYWENGTPKRIDNYEKGKLTTGTCFNAGGKKIDYFPYSKRAVFRGGKVDLTNYISQHLIYPEESRKKKIEGLIGVRILIRKDGTIGDIEVVKKVTRELDDEAIRMVRNMPAWQPAQLDGELASCHYNLNVEFKLSDSE